jgi:hypothetical protein
MPSKITSSAAEIEERVQATLRALEQGEYDSARSAVNAFGTGCLCNAFSGVKEAFHQPQQEEDITKGLMGVKRRYPVTD